MRKFDSLQYAGFLLALSLVPLLVFTSSASAQNAPAANAPRPLDALGMRYSDLRGYLGTCDKDCKQHAKEADLGHRTTFELPPYAYTVESGKVIEVMIIAESFDAFLEEGKEAWGAPTSLVYQDLTDPFGTQSRTGTARWELPGGVIVNARQTKMPGKVLGVEKVKTADHHTVHFTHKEAPTEGAIVNISNPAALQAAKPKPKNVLGEPRKETVNSADQNPDQSQR